MAGRGKLLKEARGVRDDLKMTGTPYGNMAVQSEVVTLAVLWVESMSYQGNLDEI